MNFTNIFDAPKSGRKMILAVDDQPDILDTLKKLLELQYDVYCMTSAETAMKFLKTHTPDLILLDIEMPGINGFELLNMLKEIEALKNTPVVFVTGNMGTDNLHVAAKGGADGFVSKPVDFDFAQKIKKYLKDD